MSDPFDDDTRWIVATLFWVAFVAAVIFALVMLVKILRW